MKIKSNGLSKAVRQIFWYGLLFSLGVTGVELPLLSQVVKLSESEMTQYRSADGASGANAKPSAYLYASIRTGPTGTLNGTNPADLNVAATGFTYPSLDFVFSVASHLIADGSASNNVESASKALSQVSRMNAHVRIQADAQRNERPSETVSPIQVLMIAPEELSFAPTAPGRAADIATGVEFAARFMGPLGDLVNAFQSSHKAGRAPTQIAYQSSDSEFGWTWYEASDAPIEGLHRGAALLEVPVDVTVLRVTVSLITDWKHFGPWQKSFTFHVPIPPPKK